jgi:hypothetical protein
MLLASAFAGTYSKLAMDVVHSLHQMNSVHWMGPLGLIQSSIQFLLQLEGLIPLPYPSCTPPHTQEVINISKPKIFIST